MIDVDAPASLAQYLESQLKSQIEMAQECHPSNFPCDVKWVRVTEQDKGFLAYYVETKDNNRSTTCGFKEIRHIGQQMYNEARESVYLRICAQTNDDDFIEETHELFDANGNWIFGMN